MRNIQMKFMLSKEEKDLWKKMGHRNQMNLSDFIRHCVNKEIHKKENGGTK